MDADWLPLGAIADLRPTRTNFDVAPCVMACVTDPAERAFDLIRPHVAYYVGGMGTFYRDALSRSGFSTDAERIYDLWQSGQKKEAVNAVSDGFISELAIAGSAGACRRRLEEY